MTITVPDSVASSTGLSEAQLRLELACALYAQHKISKVVGAQLAGIDFFAFQHALKDRDIPQYTEQMLEQDLDSVKNVR